MVRMITAARTKAMAAVVQSESPHCIHQCLQHQKAADIASVCNDYMVP
jgi:hypothetical protein